MIIRHLYIKKPFMFKIITLILAFLIVENVNGQQKKRFTTNIDLHINSTLYDRTIDNNGTGFGVALQGILQTRSKFAATMEISEDVYGGTKVFYMTSSGEPIYGKSGVATILLGPLYNISSKLNVGVIGGMGFFNDESYFAIKPSINYQLFNNKIIGKFAWANIFQKDNISDESFGYLSFGIGVKLF